MVLNRDVDLYTECLVGLHWLQLTCVLLALASELLEERHTRRKTGENIFC